MSLVQLITTLESREQALSLARDAVEARTAACVQVIGPITSVYRWQGEREETEEFLCLLKVPSEGMERLVQFVRDRHPYDTPELTAVGSTFVDERYLAWARSETA
ncbi:MAG TPA: divalent-cation tolerance protein CutA [Actinomycetota bacterium]|nr:divalent-cation tolerance protein CutA [Actinomycetota bacterium]